MDSSAGKKDCMGARKWGAEVPPSWHADADCDTLESSEQVQLFDATEKKSDMMMTAVCEPIVDKWANLGTSWPS